MNAAAFSNSRIVKCEEKDAPDSYDDGSGKEGEYVDVRDVHFYTITTCKGAIDVILHVDHNGYYGGWLNEPTLSNASDFPAGLPVLEN